MSEEELIVDLQRRGRTPETIQSILLGTSVQAVQRRAISENGEELPLEEAEATARRWRRDIGETVDALEAGGAWLDEQSGSFLRRSDFSPD